MVRQTFLYCSLAVFPFLLLCLLQLSNLSGRSESSFARTKIISPAYFPFAQVIFFVCCQMACFCSCLPTCCFLSYLLVLQQNSLFFTSTHAVHLFSRFPLLEHYPFSGDCSFETPHWRASMSEEQCISIHRHCLHLQELICPRLTPAVFAVAPSIQSIPRFYWFSSKSFDCPCRIFSLCFRIRN